MPFCPVCGKEINDDTKFCSECGSKIVRQGAAVAVPPVVSSPQPAQPTEYQTKKGTKRKSSPAQAAAFIITLFLVFGVIIVVINPGLLGGYAGTSPTDNPAPTNSLPTNMPSTQTTVYPTWIRVRNWYNDTIVRYVATQISTSRDYEANYAVYPWSGKEDPSVGTLAMPIPGNGAYRLIVYTSGGHTIFWDSVYLNIENQANSALIEIAGNGGTYGGSSNNLSTSTFNGITASGCT